MRKTLFIFLAFLFLSLSTSFGQSLMDYVLEVRGDVLVVKDYYDMGQEANSINNVVLSDTVDVPAGRVYELKLGGWYPQVSGFTTPTNRPVIIAGADDTPMAINKSSEYPPILSGGIDGEGVPQVGGITWGNDFTLKNTSFILGSPDGTGGWAYFTCATANKSATFINNIMEHNWWVFVQSNGKEDSKIYFKDNYFVNMSGRPCRRNGGIYDNTDRNTDTMYVENNTHVMAQGYMYKFRNFPTNFIYFNHNTFINIGSVVFETKGYQSNSIITNNMFINCNLQPFRTFMTEDLDEQSGDNIAQGLIDVMELPDSLEQVERKWLVQSNLVYWDPRMTDLAADANNKAVNGFTNWENQTMKMNARTQALFDDNDTYKYLTEADWITKLPNFTNSEDLLTDQVDKIKEFCLATIDTTSPAILPDWRLINDASDLSNFIYSDFPIPVDLSYDDADLMTAGTDELPLGDLNWFPTQKATFMANHAKYYGDIIAAFDAGTIVTDVEEIAGVPSGFDLSQNYPNPFNPTTAINFSIAKAGNVTLKVYNSLGQEITTLVDGFKNAQNYRVTFDASKLSSGVYYYSLSSGSFVQTKKMMLLK